MPLVYIFSIPREAPPELIANLEKAKGVANLNLLGEALLETYELLDAEIQNAKDAWAQMNKWVRQAVTGVQPSLPLPSHASR